MELRKEIKAYGLQLIMKCDGKCNKAWGPLRPIVLFPDAKNEDDYEMLADDELEEAPAVTGETEGDQDKPESPTVANMNKWCFRACERVVHWRVGEEEKPLPDFSHRMPNVRTRTPTR